ncbi:MAG: molybdopterin molybdotransferase MoeA [Nevskia sp.]
MTTLEDALAAYARVLRALPAQTRPTLDALGQVLAAEACAGTDLPRFDQSAMDGYALRAADTALASAANPVDLPVRLNLPARGAEAQAVLPPRSAARILTGALLPLGADAVIAQERVERIGDRLRFSAPYPGRRNVRWRGEELRQGARLAGAGQRLGPGLLAALINAEATTVRVHARPRVRVFVTGDEVRPSGTALRLGEIHDSNGPLATSVLKTWGYAPGPAQHLGDDEAEVRAALALAFEDSDLVISTGGASVGDKDYLPGVAESLGARRVFWKVAQKPAKPIFFGLLERADGSQCAMLALPGNPGAVLIGLLLHARAALDVLEGQREPGAHWHRGRLAEAVERDGERTRLVRMQLRLDDSGTAQLLPLPHQDSHMLSNLGRADVLVWIEPGSAPAPGGAARRWTAMPG